MRQIQRHSELKEWQAIIPQIPWRVAEDSATIVSQDGTTIAAIGGDLKLAEIEAAAEYLVHCANNLPLLIAAAEGLRDSVEKAIRYEAPSVEISCEAFNDLEDAIKEAKAEHLAGRFPAHLVEIMERERNDLRDCLKHLAVEVQQMSGYWSETTANWMQLARQLLGKDAPEEPTAPYFAQIATIIKDGSIPPSQRMQQILLLCQKAEAEKGK